MVVVVSWREGRAAPDLALGLVVVLVAPPGVSDGKADLVVLDAAERGVIAVSGGEGRRARVSKGFLGA